MHRMLLFLILSAAFGGCADAGEQAQPTPTGPPPLVPPDADWGAVEGFVYGPEVLPIANVTVQVLDFNASAISDADGYFAILHLEPGPYRLSVNATDYQPIVRSVNVPLADALRVDFALRPVPVPDPYIDDGYVRRGTVQCDLRANVTGQNSNPSCAEAAPEHTGTYFPPGRDANITITPGAEGFVVEVEWQPEAPVVHEKLRLAVRAGGSLSWKQIEGRSVLRLEVGPKELADFSRFAERNYTKEGGQIFFPIYPGEAATQAGVGGAGLTFQQDYTLYVTVFYRQAPVPGYSRIPK